MPPRTDSWAYSRSRRASLRTLAGLAGFAPALRGQQDPFRDHARIPRLEELARTLEFEPVFHARVPRQAYNYTAYGSDGEFTLRRNRQAFDWVKLVPAATRASGPVSTSLTLFGTPMASPILVSPTANQLAIHPEGEAAMHQGATAADATMIVSNVASMPVDQIAKAAKGPLWFQLYPKEDPAITRDTVERALSSGCRTIVVTIDQQAAAFEREVHDRHLSPPVSRRSSSRAETPRLPYRIREFRLFYEWKLFAEIRKYVRVPMIAKGVLTAEDARLCLEHGLDGIYVSNHGGRSLDYSPSSLEVLPEIVEAVGGKVPVLFDSGVRGGADALKALALGASAVCLGRVPRWGLGAYGAEGARRVLEIVQTELAEAMAVCGVRDLAGIRPNLVRTTFP